MRDAGRKIVLELEILRDPNCGLGQVAIHLGRALVAELRRRGENPWIFSRTESLGLLPPDLPHLPVREWHRARYRGLRRLLPRPEAERNAVWHLPHQCSKFWPVHPSTPVVLTIHDIDFLHLRPQSEWPKRLRRIQEQIDRARGVAAVSEATAADLRTRLNLRGKPLRIIPNGVYEPTRYAPEPVPELIGRPFLLSLGVLVEKKNFLALAAMMEHLPDLELVLAGNDATDYAPVFRERIAEFPWRDRIRLLGRVSDGCRQWLYANCTAFLFAAYAEGFGLPPLEAIRAGRPTIVAHRTSLPEVVGPDGFFWHDFEPAAMAAEVRNLLAARERDPGRFDRIRRWTDRFGWAEIARHYADWYEELFDAAGIPRRRAA